ncbi:hypothetical protein BGY98DRAFT_308790 [Russula aff. rugulosa BPL654]|nr:hypothetical protein BGY98DRAFT_308790 [Russula aff. rugulosa BPL654]
MTHGQWYLSCSQLVFSFLCYVAVVFNAFKGPCKGISRRKEFSPLSSQLKLRQCRHNATQNLYHSPPAPALAVGECHEQGLLAPKDIPHERIYLFHPKGPLALTPSDGNAGKFTVMVSLWCVAPSLLPSFLCLLFLCRLCHLILHYYLISFPGQLGWLR